MPVKNIGVSWAQPQQTNKVDGGFPTCTDCVRKPPGKKDREIPAFKTDQRQNPFENKLFPRVYSQNTSLISKDCIYHHHRDSKVEVIRNCREKKKKDTNHISRR